MKLRKRDLFLLVAAPALMLGAIGTVGGVKSVSEAAEVNATYDAEKGTDYYSFEGVGATWNNQYKNNYSDSSSVGTVSFENASHQTSKLTEYPIVKGSPVTYTLTNAEKYTITAVKFECVKWSDKATQTITLNTSDDGETFTATKTKSKNFTLEADGLSTKAIKFTFSSTGNQVGIKALTVTLKPVDTLEEDFSETAALRNLTFTYDSTVNEETGETTYSNFSNVKMQFHYELPSQFVSGHAKDLDENEKGLFVTDDANFEFKTKTSIEVAEGKVGKCYKNEGTGEKGATYTVGIIIPESKFDTKLYTRTYIKKNGKYMWGKENTAYSVLDMVATYMEDETISEEGRKICEAFGNYILEIA